MTAERAKERRAASAQAALATLDRFMEAFNARDQAAVLTTLHFPHYRLVGVAMEVWEKPADYRPAFVDQVTPDWHHSAWDHRKIIAVGPVKVHLDVQLIRYRGDNSVISGHRSLWIVTQVEARWGVVARSNLPNLLT
jgi:hypothetical protein